MDRGHVRRPISHWRQWASRLGLDGGRDPGALRSLRPSPTWSWRLLLAGLHVDELTPILPGGRQGENASVAAASRNLP